MIGPSVTKQFCAVLVKKKHIYWYCQVFGWSFYIVINSIFLGLSSQSSFKEYIIYFLMLLAGIAITHAYRVLIKSLHILKLNIPAQLLFILVFSFIKGFVFFLVVLSLAKLFGIQVIQLNLVNISEYVLNFAVVFILWNLTYFGFQYFQNYKSAEINALRYFAASKESELLNLKAQLNPHFIFNCMNSIRALIDENPSMAKNAVTRLSNILRNTLMMDKKKEITFLEEISLVRDYLDLEKIRYEDRLNFEIKIEDELLECLVPPFIIQTQVENAIKHGISKLPGKGSIVIDISKGDAQAVVTVSNTGKLNSELPLTGVGFKNSIQRLELLYGANASIGIDEKHDWVIVKINLPLIK